ncbi:hypothetical protein KD050_14345 [Psychrobacillus sp. INOP01]|uniref:hypothetical protein n=1 Tax=Psychrobacillus sp. INOP01 TaxID=2829187 RepID=UPI001BAAD6F7|nr:hypothetical protein [Psychrobacillus sp. INOP01]QUG40468.1 hypothetical protein KD050_14345 [Psychrobacillus sp. INOP01]
MRNAVLLPNGFVLTTDNSAGIGEKMDDVVSTPDEIVSYFAARVALLEQWASSATPLSIVVHNFSGYQSWDKYVTGIEKLFNEIGVKCPEITGSSETNIETLQSAIAVTMLGEQQEEGFNEFRWYAYGKPSVGEEVVKDEDKIANLKKIREAINMGLVHRVWPVGSTGIKGECKRLGFDGYLVDWDVEKSAGPATSVLLGVDIFKEKEAILHFGQYFKAISL